jgi:hypothetical protein
MFRKGGNTHRASVYSGLAMDLAQCAGLTTESHVSLSDVAREERRRCFWSLCLLKRLHGGTFAVLDFSGDGNVPQYPISTDKSSVPTSAVDTSGRPTPDPRVRRSELKDLGIITYAIQLTEVWHKAARYAGRRGKPSKYPPWSPQSDYSIIVGQQMEYETQFPYKHRFRPAKFAEQSLEDLQRDRGYWGPWLFIQFLYHTIICLINHPLLLSLQLRSFHNLIPEMFLQHTSDLISSHTDWIVYLINVIATKSFRVSDPYLSHCVAIVATIYLQQSFADDADIRTEKQDKFAKCLKFISNMGEEWPYVKRMVQPSNLYLS